MKKPFRLTSRGPESRLYSLGETPCGNCQSYSHERCRPKLDATLCSCSCERARIAHDQFDRKAAAAASAGAPIPTVAAALEILHPRYKQRF
jgi:hypothetical protein